MLDEAQCIHLLRDRVINHRNVLSMDCCNNMLMFFPNGKNVPLSEKQKRFMVCLLNGIHRKSDVIKVVWYENHETISDNNYHQLLYQFRALLEKHGVPIEILRTVPRYGVKLDEGFISRLSKHRVLPEGEYIRVEQPQSQNARVCAIQNSWVPILGRVVFYLYIASLLHLF